MYLKEKFDERKQRRWAAEAQSMIDANKYYGKLACCIHEGYKHGYYEEDKEWVDKQAKKAFNKMMREMTRKER